MIELAGSAAHVVVDDLAVPTLTDTDRHHLARVLRLRAGEQVTATDGRGSWRWCRWNGTDLDSDGPVATATRPTPEIGVGFGLLKGDKAELVVQKLTECGVDRIVPVAGDRSIVKWEGERGRAQIERLRRIAREAAMQCRRVWLPRVEDVTASVALLAQPGTARADLDAPWWDEIDLLDRPLLVIGPEGGWSPAESAAPAPGVRLSDQVLRAETAAVVAGWLLADRRRADGRSEGSARHRR